MLNRPGLAHRRLLLVDDHSIVREGLRRVLEARAPGLQVDEASSGFQALDYLRGQQPDVVVVDLSMPGMSGLDLILRIRSLYPAIRILVLSMHAEEQYAMRAFRAGAHGYLTKDSAAAQLVLAVERVASGGAYVSSGLAERFVQQLSGDAAVAPHEQLSNRELDVLQRLVKGQRLVDIADDLHLSIKTVSTHKTRILEKLQLPNLAALVRYGIENGLDRDDDTAPGPL